LATESEQPIRKLGSMKTVTLPVQEALGIVAALEASGRRDFASSLNERVLADAPDNPEALHHKAVSLTRSGDDASAACLLERAIANSLPQVHHFRNLCAIYERLGRLQEALAAGKRAVALDETDAESYHNLTVVHARCLDLDSALACARRALSLDPLRAGAHLALAEALLMRGEFIEGWEEYEWRFRLAGVTPVVPHPGKPQWDGQPFSDGKLLLVGDQGFGDVIQFARYIPWAQSRCPDILVASAPEMRHLLAQLAPSAQIVGEWESCPPYRAYVPLSGLPRLHGTNAENIPAPGPYLQAAPDRIAFWRDRLSALVPDGYRRIGLVWAGRATHPNDRNRSMKLMQLAPLLDRSKIAFIALQKGPAAAQIAGHHGRAPLINLGASISNFEEAAAAVHALDCLITVDTSMAHLAGALGRPAWVMLPFAPDWRWLLARSDTPWYPSLRLFRQPQQGDWAGVITQIMDALGLH